MTFVDIDRLKRVERDAQEARAYAESIVESCVRRCSCSIAELRVVSANPAFHDLFGASPRAGRGPRLRTLCDACSPIPGFTRAAQLFVTRQRIESHALQRVVPRSGSKTVLFALAA